MGRRERKRISVCANCLYVSAFDAFFKNSADSASFAVRIWDQRPLRDRRSGTKSQSQGQSGTKISSFFNNLPGSTESRAKGPAHGRLIVEDPGVPLGQWLVFLVVA